MELLGWVLVPYDWHPYKKGNFEDGDDTHRKMKSNAKEDQRLRKPGESRRESWDRLSPTDFRRSHLCQQFGLGLLVFRTVRK